MNKEQVLALLKTYGDAWVTHDPDKIVSIFTDDATYHDPHEPLNQGVEAIRLYWERKIVGEQSDISFELKNVWVDADTAIAEWIAEFTDIKRNLRVHLEEVAILGLSDGKFSSLREYYKSTKTPL